MQHVLPFPYRLEGHTSANSYLLNNSYLTSLFCGEYSTVLLWLISSDWSAFYYVPPAGKHHILIISVPSLFPLDVLRLLCMYYVEFNNRKCAIIYFNKTFFEMRGDNAENDVIFGSFLQPSDTEVQRWMSSAFNMVLLPCLITLYSKIRIRFLIKTSWFMFNRRKRLLKAAKCLLDVFWCTTIWF